MNVGFERILKLSTTASKKGFDDARYTARELYVAPEELEIPAKPARLPSPLEESIEESDEPADFESFMSIAAEDLYLLGIKDSSGGSFNEIMEIISAAAIAVSVTIIIIIL